MFGQKQIALLCFWMSGCMLCAQSEGNDTIPNELTIEEQVSRIDLPVVHIETVNAVEPSSSPIAPPENCMGSGTTDNDYVMGSMTIRKADNILYDSGIYQKGKSGIRIRVRGNSSANISHKSFKIKLQVPEDLFGRENNKYESKDWALLNYFSTCDLRTITGFYVGTLMGMEWEPEWNFVNLFVNGTYRGLYLLSETVGVEAGRCQINGTGFMAEADPYWWNEDPKKGVVQTKRLPYAMGYTFKYPKYKADDSILAEIKNYLDCFEDSLYDRKDISRYIDLESFATWILAHDIMGTLDGAGSNIFLKKNDFFEGEECYDSKLQMGPLWDMGTIFSTPDKWATAHYMSFFYYEQLFKRPEFVEEYLRQWENFRETLPPKVISYVEKIVSEQGKALDESRKISPRDRGYGFHSVDKDVAETKEWFAKRIPWMDEATSGLMAETALNEVRSDMRIETLIVYDMSGRVRGRIVGSEAGRLFYRSLSDYSERFHLPSGVYLLRAIGTDGNSQIRKCVF